jgi:hypothetical protein
MVHSAALTQKLARTPAATYFVRTTNVAERVLIGLVRQKANLLNNFSRFSGLTSMLARRSRIPIPLIKVKVQKRNIRELIKYAI